MTSTSATRLRHRPSAGKESVAADSVAGKRSSRGESEPAGTSRRQPLSESVVRRLVLRLAVLLAAVAVYLYGKGRRQQPELSLAGADENLSSRWQEVPCGAEFAAEMAGYAGCAPRRCGRLVTDRLVTADEARRLRAVGEQAFLLTGGGTGGASILDLHSGALSRGADFVNLYKLPEASRLVSGADLQLYADVRGRVRSLAAQQFGCDDAERLYPTGPTFFSRLTGAPARSVHDQYWHVHVDRQQYAAFHFTALVYLSQAEAEFTGGRLMFVDAGSNSTVSPRPGRTVLFTSGAENPHRVEPVTGGERYALTIAFTCDRQHGIGEPAVVEMATPEYRSQPESESSTPGDKTSSRTSTPEYRKQPEPEISTLGEKTKSRTSTPEYRSHAESEASTRGEKAKSQTSTHEYRSQSEPETPISGYKTKSQASTPEYRSESEPETSTSRYKAKSQMSTPEYRSQSEPETSTSGYKTKSQTSTPEYRSQSEPETPTSGYKVKSQTSIPEHGRQTESEI